MNDLILLLEKNILEKDMQLTLDQLDWIKYLHSF